METELSSILLRMLRQHKMTGQRSEDLSLTAMDSLQKEKRARISDVRTYTGLQEQPQQLW